MAYYRAREKRKFADTTFLQDGAPMRATDVPREPSHPKNRHLATRRLSPSRQYTASQTKKAESWLPSLRQGAAFWQPTARFLTSALSRTSLAIVHSLPEPAQRLIHASASFVALATVDGNKRRSLETSSSSPSAPARQTPRVVSATRRAAIRSQAATTPPLPHEPRVVSYGAAGQHWTGPRRSANLDLPRRYSIGPSGLSAPVAVDSIMSATDSASSASPDKTGTHDAGSDTAVTSPTLISAAAHRDSSDRLSRSVEASPPGRYMSSSIVRSTSHAAYSRLAATRQEKKLRDRLLGLSEEERRATTHQTDKLELERQWRARFEVMKKQRDVALAKAHEHKAEKDAVKAKFAELESIADLMGTTVEEVILSSSLNKEKLKAAVDAATVVRGSRTTTKLGEPTVASREETSKATSSSRDVPSQATKPANEPSSLTSLPSDSKAKEPQTSKDVSGDDEAKDPWLALVDEADLAESTATELAGLSIAAPPKLITPLSQDWIAQCEKALATRPTSTKLLGERSDITPAALATLVGKNWLNDAVINEFVQHIVARQQSTASAAKGGADKPPSTPAYVALNSNWWNTIHNRNYSVDDGIRKVLRWAKRAKIEGPKLLDVANLYIPINASAHWTLLAISGTGRTIEYLNSLDGCGPPDAKVFAVARRYLELQLGAGYDPSAWRELSSRSAQQIGGFDCGAFVCFNALALARGLVPGDAFGPEDMRVARQRISATLLNSGFSGDLDWKT